MKYTKASDFKPGSLYYTQNKTSILKFVSYGINRLGQPNLQFEYVSGYNIFFRSLNGYIGFPYLSNKFSPVKFTYGH